MRRVFKDIRRKFPATLLGTLIALAHPVGKLMGQDGESPPFGGKKILKGVERTGFYRIPLDPEVRKYMTPQLTDVRLYNSGGQPIPFLLEKEAGSPLPVAIRELKIIRQESNWEGGVQVIATDTVKDTIQGFSLEVDQGGVSRDISIQGSHDEENWKEISDPRWFHTERTLDRKEKFIIRGLNTGGFEYYRFRIGKEGQGLDPKILEVEVLKKGNGWQAFSRLPLEGFETKKIENRIRVDMEFDTSSHRVDGFELDLQGPEFFYQKGVLAVRDTSSERGWKKVRNIDVVSYAQNRSLIEAKGGAQSDGLFLMIDDHEDIPLKVSGLKVFQRNWNIIAKLRKGESYELRFGNKDVPAPGYDVPHFREYFGKDLLQPRSSAIAWNGLPKRTSSGMAEDEEEYGWTWIPLVAVIIAFSILFLYLAQKVVAYYMRK